MVWSQISCQYEGGGYGSPVDIFVETDDIEKARRLIRENQDKLKDFTEHSVQKEHMYLVSHPSLDYDIQDVDDIRKEIRDPFNPDYAICLDGTVLWMKFYGEVVELWKFG